MTAPKLFDLPGCRALVTGGGGGVGLGVSEALAVHGIVLPVDGGWLGR